MRFRYHQFWYKTSTPCFSIISLLSFRTAEVFWFHSFLAPILLLVYTFGGIRSDYILSNRLV